MQGCQILGWAVYVYFTLFCIALECHRPKTIYSLRLNGALLGPFAGLIIDFLCAFWVDLMISQLCFLTPTVQFTTVQFM